MRLSTTAVVASLLLATAAQAHSGTGDLPDDPHSVLHAADADALEDVGDDVIRFSKQPALGGFGWVLELHRCKAGWACGAATFFYGHPRTNWKKTGWINADMRIAAYEALSAQLDGLLAQPDPDDQPKKYADGTPEVIVCADGPGYLTERRKDGKSKWLSGFCGDNANNRIADIMVKAVMISACRFNFDVKMCEGMLGDDH